VEVSFRDLDNTWQRGVETDELQHSKAGKEVRIQLDEMTLTRPEGKSIARESLRESWARSKRVEWVGSYLQWDVQEDDVVSWTDADGREWVVVVDEITETADRFLEFVGYAIPREELGVTLTSESSTTGEDPRYDTGQAKTPVGYSPLFVRVFEVPPISDAHVGVPGVYVAITNTDPSVAFGGGVVFVKKPSDATWRPSLVIETPATMGIATDELATVADTTVYDTAASVNVQTWTLAELASVTEAEVDDARNLALIGPEVVGFRDATLESDGTYTLEHLRRGAMGTEAEVGEHLALEEFTLLDANVGFLPLDREDEGTTIEIKVVPPGASLDDVLTIEHEVQLLTCKPVAPAGVELTAVGNTLQVDWTYRSARTVRFRGADFVPREAGERIEIRFYNSTLASKTTPVETVRVDSDLETYTLETPYDSGLTGTDVSAEVVVITDTFGESAAAGDDLTGPGFVTIAPEEVVDFDYVDGTAQAVTGGPVTVETTDRVVAVDANAGAVTVNLPPAASATRIVTVVKVDASVNLVTIDADGAETIDGATTRTLSSQWASVNLISDGTEWFTA
jgi:hypothetical protein